MRRQLVWLYLPDGKVAVEYGRLLATYNIDAAHMFCVHGARDDQDFGFCHDVQPRIGKDDQLRGGTKSR
jgi:hypothetical protein